MAEIDRVRWRCRRGVLELDLVLERFLRDDWGSLTADERGGFTRLLQAADNDLWDWVSGRGEPADSMEAGLVRRLRAVRHSA